MDITLERVLSLIPKKEDGDFVHGAKKAFCDKIGAPPNIVNEWVRGVSKSYRNYLYQISDVCGVSVAWLKGETDEKKDPAEISEVDQELYDLLTEMKDRPDLRMLFHNAKDASPEQIRSVADMLAKFKQG